MSSQLKRCLSLTEIVIYGVGLILGAGIYVLIGATAGLAGNMLWLSFLLAALVASFTAASYAELSAMYPRAGAEYVYARVAFGWKGLAWMIGFVGIVLGFTTASAVAVGFARYMSLFVPLDQTLIAVMLVCAMSFLNYWGIKESARFNALATSIEVGGLLLIILAGGYFILMGSIPIADLGTLPEIGNGSDIAWMPVVSAGALIFFAYMGFEDIANIAEEADNPAYTLPRAYLWALVISTIIYVLVAIVAVSVIPYQELARADQPLSAVMEVLIGGLAPELIAIIALFATANTVLITLIVCARMIYGMARAKSLPGVLARIGSSRQTPYTSVAVTGIITLGFLFFKEIEVLASISDVGIFILFLFVNLSNIILRYRLPDQPRPWRVPLSIGRLPLLSLLGALSSILMLSSLQHPVHIGNYEFPSLVLGLAIFALALPLYFILGQRYGGTE